MFPNTPCWVQVATEDDPTYPDLFSRAIIVSKNEDHVEVAFENDEGLPTTYPPNVIFPTNQYDNNGVCPPQS